MLAGDSVMIGRVARLGALLSFVLVQFGSVHLSTQDRQKRFIHHSSSLLV